MPPSRVDAHGGLVEEKERGRAHERDGQRELLLHAARELARRAALEALKARERNEARVVRLDRHVFGRLRAPERTEELHVLHDGEVLVEAERLRHVAHGVDEVLVVGVRSAPEHAERA